MARVKLWDGEKIDPKSDKILEETIERWDKAPNIVRALVLNKDVLIGEDLWTEYLMKRGKLTRKFKEAIATAVSATNKCLYCASAHAWAMEYTGTSTENTEACTLLTFDGFEPKERVALEFARKATTNSKSITDGDVDKLKEFYSDSEIVEISAVIMAYMGYNTFVEMLGLEVDDWVERDLSNKWASQE